MTDPSRFVSALWRVQPSVHSPLYVATARKDWVTGDWSNWVRRWNGRSFALPDEPDLYFAPVLFSANKRTRENALPSRILYADLDAVDPRDLALKPTLAWETSRGRYQAIWLLDKALPLEAFEELNQKMTYFTGADKGGWSATKVLRIPGTVSTKYGRSRAKKFSVQLVGGRGPTYSVAEIKRAVRGVKIGPALALRDVFGGVTEAGGLPDGRAVLREHREALPQRVRRLVAAKHVPLGADRSAKLWELYTVLLQAGLSPVEVLAVVQGTVWNKYHGQQRELAQLQKEIAKAASKHAQPEELERLKRKQSSPALRGATGRKLQRQKDRNGRKLQFIRLEDFMRMEFPKPQWLVEGIWTLGAYGLWAGEYKSYKTVALLDLAVSVASGRPFLNRFNVPNPGPACYLHEEGSQGFIQDRLHRIRSDRGLGGKVYESNGRNRKGDSVIQLASDLPVFVASFPGLNLTDPRDLKELDDWMVDLKPRALILETWYLIAQEINENNASEVAPALSALARISRERNIAIILSHHYNKDQGVVPPGGVQKRASARVSGSSVFLRWYESAVFMQRKGDDDEHRVRMDADHREQKGLGNQELVFEMDTEDEEDYKVSFIDEGRSTISPSKPQGRDKRPGQTDPAEHELKLGKSRATKRRS